MELSELIACTLTDANLKTQRERWLALGESFGLGRTETEDGLRLRFRGDPAIEAELEALVAVENDCCSWAAWTVEHDDGALVIAVRSKGDEVGRSRATAPSRRSGVGDAPEQLHGARERRFFAGRELLSDRACQPLLAPGSVSADLLAPGGRERDPNAASV
jgi:hypothetical protein